MPDQREAQKLWNKICQLEREQPPAGAQPGSDVHKAWFKSKSKEMAKLKAAYQKATGVGDSSKEKDAVKHAQLRGTLGLGGVRPGEAPTTDNIQ